MMIKVAAVFFNAGKTKLSAVIAIELGFQQAFELILVLGGNHIDDREAVQIVRFLITKGFGKELVIAHYHAV